MREFFKPWRRKAGVVTLGMASTMAGAWIRSLSITELCEIPAGSAWHVCIASNYGHFSAGLSDSQRPIPFVWKTFECGAPAAIRHAHWFFDFTRGLAPNQSGKLSEQIIPYWSIVLPLTLISAYLLLSKPRPATPKQTTEPAPTTGS